MSIKIIAASVWMYPDYNGLALLRIRWDIDGLVTFFPQRELMCCYMIVSRDFAKNENKVYYEIFDQANADYSPTIRFCYSNKLLVFEVTPPETFMDYDCWNYDYDVCEGKSQEHRIEIDLSKVDFNEEELVSLLKRIFHD